MEQSDHATLSDRFAAFPDATHVLEDVEAVTANRRAIGVLRSALWGKVAPLFPHSAAAFGARRQDGVHAFAVEHRKGIWGFRRDRLLRKLMNWSPDYGLVSRFS